MSAPFKLYISYDNGATLEEWKVAGTAPTPTPEPTPTPTSPLVLSFANVSAGETITSARRVEVKSSDVQNTKTVDLFIDGKTQKVDTTESITPYQFDLKPSSYSKSSHVLTAVAVDKRGGTVEAVITVNFNTLPADEPEPTPTPGAVTLSFVNLAANQELSGSYKVTVAASDPSKVSQVQLFVGTTGLNIETSTPYDFTIDTTKFADGAHVIKAVCPQAATITVSVTTKNDVTGPEPEPEPEPTPTPTGDKDKNGMLYLQPFTAEGVKLNYSNETWTFDANFRSDGHRYDFDGVRDGVIVAGYFFIPSSFSEDEISGKVNGGPHSDSNPTYADVMDMGITNFAGTKSRVRWEKTHPSYSSAVSPTSTQMPIGSVKNKWVGACTIKANLPNGDIGLVGMVDIGGLDSDDKPVNNWKITYKRIFKQSEIPLKSVLTPYVNTIGKGNLAQNTIRIDNKPPTGLKHMYVTCKEIKAVAA